MLLRPASPADVPVIGELIRELATFERAADQAQATDAQLHAALFAENPAVFCHLLEMPDERVIGFAMWFLNFSTWTGTHGVYLEDLYVRPAFRGRGYGRAVLAHLAQICVERGYHRLQWWVLDWNDDALAFYRDLGAQAMDEWTVYRLSGEALERVARGAR